jgi:alpha-amylase/alpha-mannosidase (GH57 family)
MLTWINFLHLYQPPHQNKFIFEKVANESYRKIVKFLSSYKNIRFTLNVSGSLLEQFRLYEMDDVIKGLQKAARDGKIEFTGSAMFHPILPLLNEYEIKRQIELNDGISKELLGDIYNPRGFFLPEMCYSKKVAEIVKSMGFEWIILDEISFNGKLSSVDYSRIYEIKNIGLRVIFRNRAVSNSFVPETINKIAEENIEREMTIITATDGELYGHHHWDVERHLEKIFSNKSIRTLKISDFIGKLGDFEEIDPVDSCWESTERDLKKRVPYYFWNDPGNKLHKIIWKLAKYSMELVESRKNDQNYDIARNFLDRGLTSCTFWSASGRKSFVWKNTIWNPDMIEGGSLNLIRAVRSLEKISTDKRTKAEKMFLDIVKNIWQSHWEKYYKKT